MFFWKYLMAKAVFESADLTEVVEVARICSRFMF